MNVLASGTLASDEPGGALFYESFASQHPFVLQARRFILNPGADVAGPHNGQAAHSGGRCLARGVHFEWQTTKS
jgi:hypothetical protein